MASFLNTISAMGALVMAATPLLAATSFAHAETAAVRIPVADLDFSRPADVARFNTRVDRAADRFCRQASLDTAQACRSAIRDEAADQLGAPQRSALQSADLGQGWRVAGN